ncbi:hypothetical protein F2Q68_00016768 [Brassica cretica]|uniref:Uncharacterized protein n=1 Tax=Brassica cretica TaxID=69181 RepID=A0A8S9HD81_BRACR|nr:hypothetical protein F2Q68_00016768 [Brassica cretica]
MSIPLLVLQWPATLEEPPSKEEENNELMAQSLDLLDEKREAARLRNWSYQQDIAMTYNNKVRTKTFPHGDWVLRRAEKTTGKSPPGGKDPIRSLRCGVQAPTGCKIAKGIRAGSGFQTPPILANPRKKWHDHSCTPTKNQNGSLKEISSALTIRGRYEEEAIVRRTSSAVDRYRREASTIEDYDRSMYILYHRSMSRREMRDLVPADFKPKASPNYKITPDERENHREICDWNSIDSSDGIPTPTASSSEFPRNFVKSPNGSPTAIIFPRNSSVFSEENKFCVSSKFPRKFLGILRGFHFPSECPSEYRCFLVVVVLPRNAEYGPRENQNIPGSQGTSGPYASPRSKEETQGSPNDPGVPKIKKEARTHVQPRAHRGHYNFKEPPGSISGSKPLGSNHNHGNLRIPTTISGSIIESLDSYIASGSQSRSPDLEKRPQGPEQRPHGQGETPGSSTTSGSSNDPRVFMQRPGYKTNLQTPTAYILLKEKACKARAEQQQGVSKRENNEA